jgi:predicted nucleic acid-binding protein
VCTQDHKTVLCPVFRKKKTITHDIKDMVEAFDSCSIIHISRVQNVAAHCLARSCEFLPNSMWRGVPPDCIRETICIESLFD